MIKIAHFLRDDNKFIPDSIWCFENCGLVDNTFFCVGKKLHRLHDSRVNLIGEERARAIVEKSREYDVVCLHSLYSLPLSIIPLINKSIKVVWYSWGYDIYMNPKPYSPLLNDIDIYLPETNEILNKIPEDVLPIKIRIKKYLIEVFHKKEASSLLQDSVERVDFFAGVFPMEFNILKRKYSYFRADRTSHNYIHYISAAKAGQSYCSFYYRASIDFLNQNQDSYGSALRYCYHENGISCSEWCGQGI